jgi:ubiquitin carboxyl-terminal hydrolase 5/13
MSEALIDRVRAHMRTVKAPSHYDKVYKDECMFSYATPEAPGGLLINMQTWQVCCGRCILLFIYFLHIFRLER